MDGKHAKRLYRVAAGRKANLAGPGDRRAFRGSKEEAAPLIDALGERLAKLQVDLYAERRRSLLVILQGMDTAGKDGTLRRVFGRVNPQGLQIADFKRPSEEELAHDFLWRIHRRVPEAGRIGIFNRSHYEDVVTARVRALVPPDRWKARIPAINEFERMLAAEGTVIVKLFLHLSKAEQAARLRERLVNPDKRWKFHAGDLEDRKLWSAYESAYAETLARTSTPWAPWYAVPSDVKWYRNLVAAAIVADTLAGMRPRRPRPRLDPSRYRIR